jgi:hypothetical protein
LQHGEKEKRKGGPQSNTGKMKRGAGRIRHQKQGKVGNEEHKRKESRLDTRQK